MRGWFITKATAMTSILAGARALEKEKKGGGGK
jgi:hypothetical protein